MREEDAAVSPPSAWLRRLARRAPLAEVVSPPIKIGLRTSIAEFLLVTRLRARNLLGRRGHVAAKAEAEQAAVMAHFAHVLGVTCKHWFPEDARLRRGHQSKL